MSLREWLKLLLPPVVLSGYRQLRNRIARARPEWEYMGDTWPATDTDQTLKGWNARDVLAAQMMSRDRVVARIASPAPFDVSPEAIDQTKSDLVFHNTVMSYAYVLARVSRRRAAISMLDWGGGLGYYYLISQHLMPGLEIDYHCKEVETLAEYDRVLWPSARFYTDNTCLDRQYDFVLASCSLHYSRDWRAVLSGLARATAGSLFITRLPTVQNAASYVFIQRPFDYGYNTEYLGWCLNEQDFLRQAEAEGLCLQRQFITGERPSIAGAPEPCEYRGYLFSPTSTQAGGPD